VGCGSVIVLPCPREVHERCSLHIDERPIYAVPVHDDQEDPYTGYGSAAELL
jgi:hypothetical protein